MDKRKIIIEEREDGTLIGISRDGVDPFIKKMELKFDALLDMMPFVKGVAKVAEEQWAIAPKNPAYAAPPKAEKLTANEKAGLPKVDGKTKAVKIPAKTGTKPSKTGTKAPENETKPVENVTPKLQPELMPKERTAATEYVEALADGPAPETEAKKEPGPTLEVKPTEPTTEAKPALEASTEQASILEHHAHPRVSADAFQYKLKDGRGPFENIQLALDAMGMDKTNRPLHNRYDRLSKKLQEEILQEKKP
jgi:hypothetical protein